MGAAKELSKIDIARTTIKRLIDKNAISVSELSRRSGVNAQTIYQIIKTDRDALFSNIDALLDTLGVSISLNDKSKDTSFSQVKIPFLNKDDLENIEEAIENCKIWYEVDLLTNKNCYAIRSSEINNSVFPRNSVIVLDRDVMEKATMYIFKTEKGVVLTNNKRNALGSIINCFFIK